MSTATAPPELAELARLSEAAPGLDLLILFGSRARGDAREGSDWDLGYLAAEPFDPDGFRVEVTHALGTERVDLVDLRRANGLLRYRAAADAQVIFDRDGERFYQFWFEAVTFWLDIKDIVRPAYEALLEEMERGAAPAPAGDTTGEEARKEVEEYFRAS